MPDFKPVVGIDLGTTFSAIAFIDEYKKPVIINNLENKLTTPSVVNFSDANTFVVGDEAVNRIITDSQNTVSFIKRRMGDKNFKLNIYGIDYTPQEISAKILAKLKRDAESFFKNKGKDIEIKDAVVTVPAYFGMEQRSATKEAAEIAGLNVLNIVNEPTAAALAFGVNNVNKNQNVFVFDLGGGTFDVTLLQIKGNEINMLASDGNAELGGKDWDDMLIEYCSNEFLKKYGLNPQDDSDAYQDLYDRVLKSKISLSQRDKSVIIVSYLGNSLKIDITRDKFDELSKGLLLRCKYLSNLVLEKARINWTDVDTVLLVGGSTYMPMVRNLVKKMSDKEPSTEVNPDLCVAIGAAWQAFLQQTEKIVEEVREQKGDKEAEQTKKIIFGQLPPIKVTESVAKPLGIIAIDASGKEFVHKIIEAQKPIPYRIENDDFTYQEDGQKSIEVRITEGEGATPDEVTEIGKFVLSDLPPRRKGDRINIVFDYNKNKILEVEITDIESKKTVKGIVTFEGSMNEKEKRIAIASHKNQTQE